MIDFAEARQMMVEGQVHTYDVTDLRVLAAMLEIPREYFVPEDKYYEALKGFPRGGSNPTPEQFPGRILLAEGHKKKTRLGTLKERTITLTGVVFKEKVPDVQRTKFALLMTGYSVKIFDAELNTTVYNSGIF